MANNNTSNRGFLYGDGFFETMRIDNNDIPLWSLHIERAKKAGDFLEFTWPDTSTVESLKAEIVQNQPDGSDIVRLDFFREGGGTYIPNSSEVGMAYSYRALPDRPSAFVVDLNQIEPAIASLQPISIGFYKELTKSSNALSTFKTTSALLLVKAGLYLKNQPGLDDIILINDKGLICEALSSNILIKKAGKWYGVAAEHGPVQGVYQRYITKALGVEYTSITLEDVIQADKIILTNAATGITAAQLIG